MFQSSTWICIILPRSPLQSVLRGRVKVFQLGLILYLMTSVLWTTVKVPCSLDLLMVRNGSLRPNPNQSFLSNFKPLRLSLRTSLLARISSATIVMDCFVLLVEGLVLPTPTTLLVKPLPCAETTSPRLHSQEPRKSWSFF